VTNHGYTIRIFVPDGDPDGIRVIDRFNWTGKGIVFPRSRWPQARSRAELSGPGVYILSGYKAGSDDPEVPTLYIGQGEDVQDRIDAHNSKEFWDTGVVFISTDGGLHRGHITWLEHALIARARASEPYQCHLDNGTTPQEPALSEADKSDTRTFLARILQILPLVGIRAFEPLNAVIVAQSLASPPSPASLAERNTIVVAGNKEGFDKVFLGEDQWYSIRLSGGMIPKIKYIAGYQNAPISAVTHYAPVAQIVPYADSGKYRLVFAEPAKPVGPIPLGSAPWNIMQGPRYTSLERLQKAKTVTDLFGKESG
jgi:hypothetical protein